jgi:hypothetical protein
MFVNVSTWTIFQTNMSSTSVVIYVERERERQRERDVRCVFK